MYNNCCLQTIITIVINVSSVFTKAHCVACTNCGLSVASPPHLILVMVLCGGHCCSSSPFPSWEYCFLEKDRPESQSYRGARTQTQPGGPQSPC